MSFEEFRTHYGKAKDDLAKTRTTAGWMTLAKTRITFNQALLENANRLHTVCMSYLTFLTCRTSLFMLGLTACALLFKLTGHTILCWVSVVIVLVMMAETFFALQRLKRQLRENEKLKEFLTLETAELELEIQQRRQINEHRT